MCERLRMRMCVFVSVSECLSVCLRECVRVCVIVLLTVTAFSLCMFLCRSTRLSVFSQAALYRVYPLQYCPDTLSTKRIERTVIRKHTHT